MSFQWREGNQVSLLINSEAYFPRLFDCIRAAREVQYLRAIRSADHRLVLANAYFLVLRGIVGKRGLTVRDAGKLAVAKHTNPCALLSP